VVYLAGLITAKEWRRMETGQILQSMKIAVNVLKDRKLSRNDVETVISLAEEMLEAVADRMHHNAF